MDVRPQTKTAAVFAGMLLFVLWGLDLITWEFLHEWNVPVWVPGIFLAASLLVLPIGRCIGWIQGFPRWLYPFVAHVIVCSLPMTQATPPVFFLAREYGLAGVDSTTGYRVDRAGSDTFLPSGPGILHEHPR